MRRLDLKTRTQIIAALVEGNSIASTCRMTGVAKRTVLQCDEIWSFRYAKDKNVPERMRDQEGVGSVWTWTAIDADTKLMLDVVDRRPRCRLRLDVVDRRPRCRLRQSLHARRRQPH